MRRFSVREITLAAAIAAVYVALTFALPFPPYMGVQFRVAEALTVLPFFPPRRSGKKLRHFPQITVAKRLILLYNYL